MRVLVIELIGVSRVRICLSFIRTSCNATPYPYHGLVQSIHFCTHLNIVDPTWTSQNQTETKWKSRLNQTRQGKYGYPSVVLHLTMTRRWAPLLSRNLAPDSKKVVKPMSLLPRTRIQWRTGRRQAYAGGNGLFQPLSHEPSHKKQGFGAIKYLM